MEIKKGKFYAVSTGVGDPELITLKALRILKETKVWAVPVSPNGSSTVLHIVEGLVDCSEKKMLMLKTAMSTAKDVLQHFHDEQANEIEQALGQGEDVAMISLGDVSLYSTAAYIVEKLMAKGYECAMIPGVTSACAAACALNLSLADMKEAVHIIPAAYGDMDEALSLKGTKVLMKSGKSLSGLLDKIREKGLSENAALVANCGMENEVLCRDINEMDKMTGYFTTVVVKDKEV